MLAITLGSAAIVSWIVTLNVTSYETKRADEQVTLAVTNYRHHVEDRNHQIGVIVRILIEDPSQRERLKQASANGDASAKTHLKIKVLGEEIPKELTKARFGTPAFQLNVNEAGELVAALDPSNTAPGAFDVVKSKVEKTLKSGDHPLTLYVPTPAGLALVLGIPLHADLQELPDAQGAPAGSPAPPPPDPTDAYFLGYPINDAWFKEQLLTDRQMTDSTSPALNAWFFTNDRLAARASSDSANPQVPDLKAEQVRGASIQGPFDAIGGPVDFVAAGEHYSGRVFDLDAEGAPGAMLVLASSRDKGLAPLHALQRKILLITAIACMVAIIVCRFIASMISRPIGELVAGTRRIAAAQFDHPVHIHRRDELGVLADSFNQMAEGLKERDGLREQRVKLERDMAVARKIQMDVLPKSLPACPGYDMAAFSHPAEQTGGDIYDLVALALDPESPDDPASLVLLLADATGHGIGPALSVTQVRSMLRIGVRLRAQLDDVFAQINRQLCQDLGSERFVTAFLGLLDPSGHSIDYHSAGQGPLLHFHGKNHRFEWLDTSMLPLGIEEDAMSDGAKTINIECGDLIVLLTDGFYECSNGRHDQFGRERIAEIILQHHHRPAREVLNEILAACRVFADGLPQEDDMTGLIIRRLPLEE